MSPSIVANMLVVRRDEGRGVKRATSPRHRQGAAVVELALVIPFLGCLLLGICETGQALCVADILAEASRNACAVGSQPGSSNSSMITEAQAALSNAGLPINTATVTILINGAAGDVANANRNDQITVTVSIPWTSVSITGTSFYLPHGSTQFGITVMMKQG